MIVPTDVPLPVTVLGLRLRAVTEGAVTVTTAVLVTPFPAAEIVDVALVRPLAPAVTVKVAVEEPAGTVIEAGTVAAVVLLEVRATVTPVPPALPERVTVPVEVPA